jgi:NodT family efflux transporter outer membrane factor (OMF) lipoprotein
MPCGKRQMAAPRARRKRPESFSTRSLTKAHPLRKLHTPITLFVAATLLAACAQQPSLPDAARPLSAEQLGLEAHAGKAWPAELNTRWWTAFQDPQLDALISRAVAESPTLGLARARIERAGAGVQAAKAADYPNIGLGFDTTQQRYTANGLYPPPLAGSTRSSGTLQAGLSYEWDFFGRNKAALTAALGQVQAAQAEAAAARLMLASQVARSYFALARLLAQHELLGQQIALREQALTLVRERSAAGLDNAQELRSAESPLPELRRQGMALDELATLLRHQLAALSAQPSSALQALKPQLPELLAMPANTNASGSSLPSLDISLDLLGRRPDVQAARWRVEASTQDVAVARALFYPNISLTAFAGFSSIGLDRLLQSGSQQYGVGPSLRLPLFDSGRLSANLRGTAAQANEAVAAYNAALLEAVRDASDQLTSVASLQRQHTEQDALLANAQAVQALAQTRFEAGLGNRLIVLGASQARLQQQRQALDLRGQRLDAQVSLMRSLGGGWTARAQ